MKRIVTVVLFCFLLAGCGSPINKSNYERIENGMTVSQVEGILGRGTEQSSSDASFAGMSMSAKQIVWQEGNQIITITFMNDKVQAKAQLGL